MRKKETGSIDKPFKENKEVNARVICVGLITILLDQISKFVAVQYLPQVVNAGFSFGLGQGTTIWLFVILLVIVVFDSLKRGIQVPDACIISGGLSNILDRYFRGGVVDWIHLGPLWFNFSDISITVGVLWILLSSLRTIRS